jgi:cytochrome c oxidase assembly factor CtaG
VTPLTAALSSWSFEPQLVVPLLVTGAIYARGWHDVWRQMPQRFPPWRLAAFLGGLLTIFVATASPLDAFAGLLLQVHMTQHLLLTMVAPPLLWLGAPATPLLRGLPVAVRKDALGPFLSWPGLQRSADCITHPLVCWLVFVLVVWFWHLPTFYELALRVRGWHQVEHASFLTAALLFWWPVIQPWPSAPVWPRWTMIPYLLLADVQNTIFSGFLAFSERVLYPSYALAPRLWNSTPMDDQAAAAVIMWVPGSIVFLLPLVWIINELLAPRVREARAARPLFPTSAAARFDLLRMPLLGRILRWPYFRRCAQVVMAVLALAVVVDGLLGPQMSPMNLAGVLPWTYWRGFAVIALLAAGNVFCMACPFMLPRDLARRWLRPHRRWPRVLRSKWLAVALLLTYLWAYEALHLWERPWWTAWIVISYFGAAVLVDGLFRNASFCKYVCPIGQFHFVQSLVSPLEIAVRQPTTCQSCTTYDCIRGNAAQHGCELQLFQPLKLGNFDCTFCLDCVQACPHDNVGILAVVPGRDLSADGYRSSIGRWARRPDVAALVLLLVVGAFVNAAGMVEPVVTAEGAVSARLGIGSMLPVVTGFTVGALAILGPMVAVLCGLISRALGTLRASWREDVCRFVLSLVPLGFAMWCAHFLFHLFSGLPTALPVAQRVANDLGVNAIGVPQWASAGIASDALMRLEILLLDGGLLLTLYVGWRIARALAVSSQRALGALFPWAAFATALYAVGVWLVFQPMQMRGMMMH